jgi:hypothetical protein
MLLQDISLSFVGTYNQRLSLIRRAEWLLTKIGLDEKEGELKKDG